MTPPKEMSEEEFERRMKGIEDEVAEFKKPPSEESINHSFAK
jgi:hypothetical protein